MRGTFIALEGGEGSGKTTIGERLKLAYPDAVYTQDPGGTALGEHVRKLLMSDETAGIDVRAELLLFLAGSARSFCRFSTLSHKRSCKGAHQMRLFSWMYHLRLASHECIRAPRSRRASITRRLISTPECEKASKNTSENSAKPSSLMPKSRSKRCGKKYRKRYNQYFLLVDMRLWFSQLQTTFY